MARIAGDGATCASTIDDEATTTAASAVVVSSASSVVVVFLRRLGIGGADDVATTVGCDGDGDAAVAAELPPQAAVSSFAEAVVRRRALFSALLFSISVLFNLGSFSNSCTTAFTRCGAVFLFLLDGGDAFSWRLLHQHFRPSVDQLSTRRKPKDVHPNIAIYFRTMDCNRKITSECNQPPRYERLLQVQVRVVLVGHLGRHQRAH